MAIANVITIVMTIYDRYWCYIKFYSCRICLILYFHSKIDMINIILDISQTHNQTIMLKEQITQELEKLPEPLLQEI